jgi:histidine phosphotransfer protein HptB
MEDQFPLLLHTYIRDATDALTDMAAALTDGDAEHLRRRAHSLKGSSANLGASLLAQHLQQLEDHALDANLERAESVFITAQLEGERVISGLQRLIDALHG